MTKVLKIVVFVCGLTPYLLLSQSASEKGDLYYERYAYKKAIRYYSQALKKEERGATIRKVASSYRLLKDFENAEIWYAKLMESSERQTVDIYYYAEMLKSNGKYTDYLRWIRRYQKSAKDDSRAERALENQSFIKVLLEDKGLFEISGELPFNSKYSEISPAFYLDEELLFSSNRHAQFKLFGPKDNYNDGNFYDLYAAPIDSAGNFGGPVPYSVFNTKYHEVGVSFNKDGDQIYFGRTNYLNKELEKSSSGDLNLAIFYSEQEEGYWTEEKKLDIGSKEYSTDHPSLSRDGKLLFFASDMDGGYGGFDIYVIQKDGNSWGKPINLGKEINTEGNEVFPFYHKSGRLYFSSDGLPGLGGLDVFEAKITKEFGVYDVKNLGFPVNEMKDDFGLIMNDDMTGGYLSSNRPGGMGEDDIYSFVYHKPKYDNYNFEGLVVELDTATKNEILIPDAYVILKDKYGVVIDTTYSDSVGFFNTSAEIYGDYYLVAGKEGYIENTERVLITRGNEQKLYELKIFIDSVPPPIDSSAYVLKKLTDFEWEINQRLDTLESLADKKLGGYKLTSPDKKFIYAEERDIAVYLDSLGTLVDLNKENSYVEDVDNEFYSGYNGEVNGEVESLNKIFFAKELVGTEKEAQEKLAEMNKDKNKDKDPTVNELEKEETTTTANKVTTLDKSSFKNTEILKSIDGVKVVDDHTIIPPVYFNFNDDKINKYSMKSMKKILKFMKKNEDVMLEIKSYTDCRGDSTYNVRLSERRSQNAALYLVKEGVFLGRVRAYGIGESEPVNNCDCDDKGFTPVHCTESHHRENRRSEFSFIKLAPVISRESVLNE